MVAMMAGYSAAVITDKVLQRAGAKYSREQELEADLTAQQWLAHAQRDTVALAQVLYNLHVQTGDSHAEPSPYDDHPTLLSRMLALPARTDTSETARDPAYEAAISECLMSQAWLQIIDERYAEATATLDRALLADWHTGELYFMRAIALRRQKDTAESNREALAQLQMALGFSNTNAWIYGELGLINMRLGDTAGALEAFGMLREHGGEKRTVRWAGTMIDRINSHRLEGQPNATPSTKSQPMTRPRLP
jgi:predicted Zn-dependent protease